MKRSKHKPTDKMTARSYRSRGVDVEIKESKSRVEVKLDGVPIDVSVLDGKFHSQLANQFTEFGSLDALVDTLLANEGRTWSLHGDVCNERCGPGGHHHDHGSGGGHDHGGGHHDHGEGGHK